MTQRWRQQTAEIAPVRSPGMRLLPAMLVGTLLAVAIGYFVIGLKPRAAQPGLPELELHIEGERLRLPDDSTCPLARHGCQAALVRLPPAVLRIVAPSGTPFALAVPALTLAADGHRPVLLDDGMGPVEVEPTRGGAMKEWASPNEDLAALRMRVILRSDGLWVGTAAGKLLGADPRGPTLLPTPSGQDFSGLSRKLRSVRATLKDSEDACGLLPTMDMGLGDVVRAATAIHGSFGHLLLVVP
jgi:hypothetical protein